MFITLIISALVVLFTSTSPSDAPLSLLLFLLLLRLRWLLLMVRRLKITNIYIVLWTSAVVTVFMLCVNLCIPFVWHTLILIAVRSKVKNCLHSKVPRRQLLQQLSVTLWNFNAKIIHRQYTICAEIELVFGYDWCIWLVYYSCRVV